MSGSVFSNIKDYISQLNPQEDSFFQRMEEYAKKHSVPIMEKSGLLVMLHYFRLLQPKRVLEIGTAIGYSALKMAEACPDSHVFTIERDLNRVEEANHFIAEKKQSEAITILVGDALEISDEVAKHAPFDILFIDAAKGQYQKFFELYSPYVQKGGFIFSDNVLFKGLVAQTNQEVNKRIEKMIAKIHSYNEWLHSHPSFDTVLLPVGDGLAVSRKKE
ncbi:O-methyltransferase [Bacillus litorisediminis]|uniref:O-methyltransferase n=1 Tax=Bacillus litorisediminis TaxID=2922713 RepID=UPI001FAC106D|nr:O-methyltransferase [Bacillus litorisediminis]